jgi:hypothetical protein
MDFLGVTKYKLCHYLNYLHPCDNSHSFVPGSEFI